MANQSIGLGTVANDGTGDNLRSAGTKINANFVELYARIHIEASTDPGVNDDVDNYEEGTLWLNQSTGQVFVLVDDTDGAAVWELITLSVANLPSGATQVAAGAAAGELWVTASHATLPDDVVMRGS